MNILDNRWRSLLNHMHARGLGDLPVACVHLPAEYSPHIELADHDLTTLLRWADTLADAHFTVIAALTMAFVIADGRVPAGPKISVQTLIRAEHLTDEEIRTNTISADRLRWLAKQAVTA
ncbi:hypothetical protein ORV05_04700 [Amycolatopsis cynarae]|uniref:Uncharacterized protein n=1 Tax=Amycolatopsis cynarae TaxID=2995223 RepID=A0ABY7B451_9PSEU|nr:hypothetical protein [Amycolatopsis sp. HUAS 11-8]WAL67090.1 hypothetical protein ORV05_04700 [Amycolatopsis sp. HUAS 11-8]